MNTDPITSISNGSTPDQMAASLQAKSPGATTGAGSADPTLTPPPVSSTQDASAINNQITNNTQGVIFPPAPGAPTTGVSNNTGIPSTIPGAAAIESQGTQQTPAEKTNTSLLQKVAALVGGKQGQTSLTNTAESAAGVPGLQKTVNDLNTQLEGLTNQATDLQNQASPGGAIENQKFQNMQNSNVFDANRDQTTALRENQIKQSAIASQSLTLKSAIYGAQGNLTLAKDAADKAATAQFEDQQNQIDYMNSLIAANAPQMNKEEQAQADLVKQQLADRQTQINNAKEDKVTAIGYAVAAMKNNPNDQAANYAAQQALKLDPSDPQYMQKVLGLVGQYQTDPLATAKEQLDLANARKAGAAADAAQAVNDANNTDIPTIIAGISNPNLPSSALGGLTVNGLTQKAQAYLTNGGNIQGLGLSNSGAAGGQRTLIANYAGYLADKMGMTVPEITAAYKANSKAATQVIERVAKIDTTANTLTSQFPRLAQAADKVGGLGITESDLAAGKAAFTRKFGSKDAASYFDLIQTIRSDYSAMQSAVAGGRGGTFFSQTAVDAIPTGLTSDQYTTIGQTIEQSASLATQASGQEAQGLIMGGNSPTGGSSGSSVTVNGQSYTIGTVYQDGSGAKWTVDASGKWTKQ